jgi:hypothetical protein
LFFFPGESMNILTSLTLFSSSRLLYFTSYQG